MLCKLSYDQTLAEIRKYRGEFLTWVQAVDGQWRAQLAGQEPQTPPGPPPAQLRLGEVDWALVRKDRAERELDSMLRFGAENLVAAAGPIDFSGWTPEQKAEHFFQPVIVRQS